MNSVVVRAVGGRRSEYRPIVSRLTSSTDPVEIARVLVSTFRPAELYLADLDAIAGKPLAIEVYQEICSLGGQVWVDAGVRDLDRARQVADAGCVVVAGLETVPGPDVLREIVEAIGTEKVAFSLDLRDGVPVRSWPDRNPVATVVGCGITRLIVLDLARVGGGAGTGTDDLCREVASANPHIEVIAGGGVRGPEDLKRLDVCGVKGVLVASALHDGRIHPVE